MASESENPSPLAYNAGEVRAEPSADIVISSSITWDGARIVAAQLRVHGCTIHFARTDYHGEHASIYLTRQEMCELMGAWDALLKESYKQ